MKNLQEYVVASLELHLFFARIMKEHALFLKVGLLPPAACLAREVEQLLRQFDALLSRAVALSSHIVRPCVLESGEVLTEFTGCAEHQTHQLTGTVINHQLTAREQALRGCCGNPRVSQALACQVRRLNRDTLAQVNRLIRYKRRLLQGVNSCQLATANYPLLIEHILREAQHYRSHLMRLEGMGDDSCQTPCDSEPFWNRIMMEHALFIRGLLDPTEEELIHTADGFAGDFKRLLEASAAANDKAACHENPEALTKKFRDFKREGAAGIAHCQIRSLILPLLADHVLREANHYLRLLEA